MIESLLTLFRFVFTDRASYAGSAAPWQAWVEVEAEESTCSGKATVLPDTVARLISTKCLPEKLMLLIGRL